MSVLVLGVDITSDLTTLDRLSFENHYIIQESIGLIDDIH